MHFSWNKQNIVNKDKEMLTKEKLNLLVNILTFWRWLNLFKQIKQIAQNLHNYEICIFINSVIKSRGRGVLKMVVLAQGGSVINKTSLSSMPRLSKLSISVCLPTECKKGNINFLFSYVLFQYSFLYVTATQGPCLASTLYWNLSPVNILIKVFSI